METADFIRCFTGLWYDRTAADGRQALLFGGDYREKCIGAVLHSVEGGPYFGLYSEFPLNGGPYLDLSAYTLPGTDGGTEFAAGDGFGCKPLFDYWRSAGERGFGFEFDLSADAQEKPHVIVFPGSGKLKNPEFTAGSLALMGCADRAEAFTEKLNTAPEGWEPAYFGGYSGRTDSPVRIVFRLKRDKMLSYRENPGEYLRDLERFGYRTGGRLPPDTDILLRHTAYCRISFDLLPGGTVGPVTGCEYGITRDKLSDLLPDNFMKSENAAFIGALEREGFIDSRWRSAVQSAFAEKAVLEDGTELFLRHSLHTVKLRQREGEPLPPKMYTEFVCYPVK